MTADVYSGEDALVDPFHRPVGRSPLLRRADRVRLWLGIGATALIALAGLATGIGFMVEAGGSSLPGAAVVVGLVIVVYGVLVGVSAYGMARLRARSAGAALKSLALPALLALGAVRGAFDDGFHGGAFVATAGLVLGIVVFAVLIAQARTVLDRLNP